MPRVLAEAIYRALMMLAHAVKTCYLEEKTDDEARPPPRPLDSSR